jgi:hypothetical protein
MSAKRTNNMEPRRSGPPPEAHCEYCGLSYDDASNAAIGDQGEAKAARDSGTKSRRPSDAESVETHCEFCGAEYPVPTSTKGAEN